MENETNEAIIDSPETNEEEVVEETTEEVVEETTPEKPKETPEAKKARLTRELKQVNKKLGVEEEVVKPKVEKKVDTSELTTKDVLYLSKADIHEEDLDEVTNYAAKNGVTVKEAHKYLKPILEVKVEQRKTAEATEVKGGGRGASQTSGDSILEKAESTGEVPTTEAGMKKMVESRMARAKKEIKN